MKHIFQFCSLPLRLISFASIVSFVVSISLLNAFTGIIGVISGLFIFVLAISSLLVGAFPEDTPETPKADSKGTGKVETGDTNLADIKMSTEAEGKNVKSSSSMEATSSKEKGSTKGEAKTEVKGSRKKR